MVQFVFDRTIGWGKLFETLSANNIVDGMVSKQGTWIASPTPMSLRKAYTTLRCLVANEILLTTIGSFGKYGAPAYGLNIDPDTLMLRLPKNAIKRDPALRAKKEETATSCRELSRNYTVTPSTPCQSPLAHGATPPSTPCQSEDEGKKIGTELKREPGEEPGSAKERVEAKAHESSLKTHSLLHKKVVDAMTKARPSGAEVQGIWNAALAETFPNADVMVWTKKEIVRVNQFCRRYGNGIHKMTFGAFIDWAVRSWRYVLESKFRRMASREEFPVMRFLIAFEATFLGVANRWDELAKEVVMPSRDRAIKHLVEGRMPLNIAEQEVDARSGVTNDLRKNQKVLADIKVATLNFERTRQREENLALARKGFVKAPTPPPTKLRKPEEIAAEFASIEPGFGPYISPEHR